MRILKRGQSSMEFLMTYGWAIMAVIIALAALFLFGITDNKKIGQTCIIAPGFSCGVSLYSNAVQIELKNGYGTRINNIKVNVIGLTSGSCPEDINPKLTKLDDGESAIVTVSCTIPNGKAKGTLKIEYTENDKILPRIVQGQVSGTISTTYTSLDNPPTITLVSPANNYVHPYLTNMNLRCTATDDKGLTEIYLYNNFGDINAIPSKGPTTLVSGTSATVDFNVIVPLHNTLFYKWNCEVKDNGGNIVKGSSDRNIRRSCGNGIYDAGETCAGCTIDAGDTHANCPGNGWCCPSDGACYAIQCE